MQKGTTSKARSAKATKGNQSEDWGHPPMEETALGRLKGHRKKYGLSGFLTRAPGAPGTPSPPWAYPWPSGGLWDLRQTKANNLET